MLRTQWQFKIFKHSLALQEDRIVFNVTRWAVLRWIAPWAKLVLLVVPWCYANPSWNSTTRHLWDSKVNCSMQSTLSSVLTAAHGNKEVLMKDSISDRLKLHLHQWPKKTSSCGKQLLQLDSWNQGAFPQQEAMTTDAALILVELISNTV